MKIVAISDTHNRHKDIKDFKDTNALGEDKTPLSGEVIIHSGDATGRGASGECESFIKWFGGLDFKHKIFIPGNHDHFFEKEPERARELCKKHGVTLLIDESVVIAGVKIHGSPYQPWFFDWAFNAARDQKEEDYLNARKDKPKYSIIKPHWDMIPEDTNILVTHGPPYEILDELVNQHGYFTGQHVGCVELAKRIKELNIDVHIFGHVHCSNGEKHLNGTSYYNASICDERYIPSNPITIIDYEKEETSNGI